MNILLFQQHNLDEFPYLCPPKNWVVMFAVIKIGGQQFKVQAGQSLFVPHLTGKNGDKVEFSDILMFENEGKVNTGGDAKATVKAEIIEDTVKGDKVIAFKMKRRKGFRKKHGHRTHYTQIKVTDII
jgi:large subunit ribosomal protein L21